MRTKKYNKNKIWTGELGRKRLAWLRFKAQCDYRSEECDITWDQWQTIWSKDDHWLNRGRSPHDFVLSRLDWEGDWTIQNVCIMTRYQQLLISRYRRSDRDIGQFYEDIVTFTEVKK
jgi:hypothetical protein